MPPKCIQYVIQKAGQDRAQCRVVRGLVFSDINDNPYAVQQVPSTPNDDHAEEDDDEEDVDVVDDDDDEIMSLSDANDTAYFT